MKPRRKEQPERTGTYNNARLTQGAGDNKTRATLAEIAAQRGNQQLLWDNALTDLPGNRTYAQFKQALASREGPALLDAYARENRLQALPTREQYAQAQFQAAQQRFWQRADAEPGKDLFGGAPLDAYRAQAGAQFVDNTLSGAASEGMAPSQAELARYYQKTENPGMSVAPGMTIRRAAPSQPAVVPRRSIAAR